MKPELQYTQSLLNRADELRRSPERIGQLWNDPGCLLVPVYQNKNLFDSKLEPVMMLNPSAQANALIPDLPGLTFLGLRGDVPYFSSVCSDEQADAWCEIFPDAAFSDLRTVGAALRSDFASVLAYARGVSHWQNNNGFCARCGSKNNLLSAGHMMTCTSCEACVFPRTDPAVIMLVEHAAIDGKRQCLLGRSPAWPAGCYSTLAGFVETGESIEAAVIREVFEETGVVVTDPVYVASQPWPFPQSVMLGFKAKAENLDLVVDQHELADAAWFTADEIRTFGEWADNSDGFKLPRVDSIARHLINQWIEEVPDS